MVKQLSENKPDQISWTNEIVKEVVHKCNNRLNFLYRNKECVNQNTRNFLCNALTECYLDYASSSWYSALSNPSRIKVQLCKNKMAIDLY